MGVIEIANILEKGNNSNNQEIQILFKEGLNMRQIAEVIEKNTNNTKEDFYNLLKDEILNFHYNNSIALVVCEDCHDKVDKKFHKQKNLSIGGIKKYYETK